MVLDGLVVSILSILIGLYVGLLRGGLLRNLGLVRVSWWGLIVAGIVLPVFVSRVDPGNGVPLVVVALLALVVFARRNRHLLGMGIVAVGVLANLAVVVVNNGMPVRADALVDAGLAESHEVDNVEISGVQRLEQDGDTLMFLADVIPLRATQQVLSIGDLVILVGLGAVSSNLLRNRMRADKPQPPGERNAKRDATRDTKRTRERPAARDRRAPRERKIPDFEPILVPASNVLDALDDLGGRELVGATAAP